VYVLNSLVIGVSSNPTAGPCCAARKVRVCPRSHQPKFANVEVQLCLHCHMPRSVSGSPSHRASRSPLSRSPRRRSRSRSPGQSQAGNPGNNLYVNGLASRTTDAIIRETFSRYGTVVDCRLVTDPRSHESRGFGFITMGSSEEAEAAIEALNRTDLDGRTISVEKVSANYGLQ